MYEDTPDWPEIWVFDEIGIYVRCHKGTNNVSAITFAFHPEHYAFSPKEVFKGALKINGIRVSGAMTERDLPIRGPLEFRKWSPRALAAESGAFSVSLRLSHTISSRGGKSGKPLLTAVEFSYSDANLPREEISKRISKN
jgi:hypothetical protein